MEAEESQDVDVLIIGAGPCGLAVAIAAKEAGLRYRVVDKGAITQSLIGYPYYMTFFSTAERLEIGGVPFTIPDQKPSRREALAYYRRVVEHHQLTVSQYEEVHTVTANGSGFIAASSRNGHSISTEARAVVIATGGFGEPNHLEVEGGASEKVIHYYREPYPFFDQDVLVVGGANSAVEAALELHRNGARVQMVHFNEVFDRGVKPWVRPDIENRIAQNEIRMHWSSRVDRIEAKRVDLRSEKTGDVTTLANDWVVAMTGWQPDRSLLLGLGATLDEETGIPAHDPTTMETDRPGVYIAGVIAAGFNANKIFIENGREHGVLIARHLASGGGRTLDETNPSGESSPSGETGPSGGTG